MRTLSFLAALLFSLIPSTTVFAEEIDFSDEIENLFLYSSAGREHVVQYSAWLKTEFKTLEDVKKLDQAARDSLVNYELKPLTHFQFGPLTHRELGGPKRNETLNVRWDEAKVENDSVLLPYDYQGAWILRKDVAALPVLELPVPVNMESLRTTSWLRCTDSAPDHQTWDFFWYFWDPTRWGCDHKEHVQYEVVAVSIGKQTPNLQISFPEYSRLFREVNGKKTLSMTFAFGYVEDPEKPNPERDNDEGVAEYRTFLAYVKQTLAKSRPVVKPILAKEFKGNWLPNTKIGSRFEFKRNGVQVTVNVVVAAGLDAMDLFAKSYAHDHEGFFAWMGHSRVGSGFDAAKFERMAKADPEYFSVTKDYQIIYWGGCNSYSYYTLPFFAQKAKLDLTNDPNGTKNLDIIANGLPSLFMFNATNAKISLHALLEWERNRSYQEIVDAVEANARKSGTWVLNLVLGDEDNATH